MGEAAGCRSSVTAGPTPTPFPPTRSDASPSLRGHAEAADGRVHDASLPPPGSAARPWERTPPAGFQNRLRQTLPQRGPSRAPALTAHSAARRGRAPAPAEEGKEPQKLGKGMAGLGLKPPVPAVPSGSARAPAPRPLSPPVADGGARAPAGARGRSHGGNGWLWQLEVTALPPPPSGCSPWRSAAAGSSERRWRREVADGRGSRRSSRGGGRRGVSGAW